MTCRTITPQRRQSVFERDNYTCQYCGIRGDDALLEVDHIIPVSRGGSNDFNNLITSCRACNRAKRDKVMRIEELTQIADKIHSSASYLMSLIEESPEWNVGGREGRSRKLTLYLTPALDDDVKDLARIQRLSTPDYIFRLIERERDRRADALAAFRALEEE